MPADPAHLAARLSQEAEKTGAFFQRLAPAAWEQVVYTDGAAWNVRQVLAHFTATEAGMQALLRQILAGGEGVPADFDINAYNHRKTHELEGLTPVELLDRFQALRQANIALVASLAPADLQRPGRHPFLGMTTVEEIIKLLYRHNQLHQRDIRK